MCVVVTVASGDDNTIVTNPFNKNKCIHISDKIHGFSMEYVQNMGRNPKQPMQTKPTYGGGGRNGGRGGRGGRGRGRSAYGARGGGGRNNFTSPPSSRSSDYDGYDFSACYGKRYATDEPDCMALTDESHLTTQAWRIPKRVSTRSTPPGQSQGGRGAGINLFEKIRQPSYEDRMEEQTS